MNSEIAWHWRPRQGPWYRQIAEKACQWQPADALNLDVARLHRRLVEAAEGEEGWLMHPCLNALTLARAPNQLERDFQVAVWTAVHTTDSAGCQSLGSVVVPQPMWIWSEDGGSRVEQGTCSLQSLVTLNSSSEWPAAVALDVWCRSLGFPHRESWALLGDLSPEQQQQLNCEITTFLRALVWAQSHFQDCTDWIASVTRVAIPLYSQGDTVFRSGSAEDLPGMVYLDLFAGEIQIMEALVHESAHRHQYLAEALAPLVEPGHSGKYPSPLRPEPRPLRGILMAFHALSYICSFYHEVLQYRPAYREDLEDELSSLLEKLEDAEQTLLKHRRFLTAEGMDFLAHTIEVANYARR